MQADSQRKAEGELPVLQRAAHSILVVDDNPAMCYAVARSLRAGGYRTVEALTGLDALQLVAGASAVVLDVALPDVDGMELCRLVRASPIGARIPIVHVSSKYTDAVDVIESSKAGADTYLVMPVDAEHMLSVIDRLLLREQR